MKAFNLKSIVLATVTGVALMSAPAMAGHHGGEGHHQKGGHKMKRCDLMGHGMFRGLDLTSEQKDQIKAMVKTQKEEVRAKRNSEEGKAFRQQMKTLITSAEFDKAQAEELIAQKQEKHQQGMLMRLETQNKIYNMLTSEQQQKLQKRMEKCASRAKGN
ncbi:Spy/CpxP family protein refolding chaperone [Shewanella corallii]|uniref:Spy/CpxP family protein refolding chaperone n=1 Tax=Shewanella corallii TaxID=560080 RepID=A0ABT0N9Y6_9GAMM|nr:Spy/CpxP family protein refolding chaperone [Shewanella corallii]MCL2915282.1 Spy/CpxP family protein refolding chaperone [Shewanella corallii]